MLRPLGYPYCSWLLCPAALCEHQPNSFCGLGLLKFKTWQVKWLRSTVPCCFVSLRKPACQASRHRGLWKEKKKVACGYISKWLVPPKCLIHHLEHHLASQTGNQNHQAEPNRCLHILSFQTAVSVENPLLGWMWPEAFETYPTSRATGFPYGGTLCRAWVGFELDLILSTYNMIHVSVSPTHPCLAEARDFDSCLRDKFSFSSA